ARLVGLFRPLRRVAVRTDNQAAAGSSRSRNAGSAWECRSAAGCVRFNASFTPWHGMGSAGPGTRLPAVGLAVRQSDRRAPIGWESASTNGKAKNFTMTNYWLHAGRKKA